VAFVPLVAVTKSFAVVAGLEQAWLLPVLKAPDGTPIDFSSWYYLAAYLDVMPAVPDYDVLQFGVLSQTAPGQLMLRTYATDFQGNFAGTAPCFIYGIPVSGDDPQLLCKGSITVGP
jgi:hypothetical protein